jgi:hypothetical protein
MPGDTCTTAANCRSGGVCIADAPPNTTSGHCAYHRDRYLITTADAYGNHYGGLTNYSAGSVKWGETAAVGGWAGAGTNGGLNFALLSNSCGIRPGFDHQQDSAIFAGVAVLGLIMPTTYGSASRGDWIRGALASTRPWSRRKGRAEGEESAANAVSEPSRPMGTSPLWLIRWPPAARIPAS